MKKHLLILGMLILAVLIPSANLLAGNEKPVMISVRGKNFINSEITVQINADIINGKVNITPVNGVNVSKVERTINGINITLSNNGGSVNFGGKDDYFDIMTIVGIDNITGVFVDNNSTDASHRTLSTLNNIFDDSETNTGTGNSNSGATPFIYNEENMGNEESGSGGNVYVPKSAGFTIYPNPVQQEANIVTVGEILGKSITVVDLSGRVHKVIRQNVQGRSTINLSDLQPGIYMIIMETENGKSYVQRISKL